MCNPECPSDDFEMMLIRLVYATRGVANPGVMAVRKDAIGLLIRKGTPSVLGRWEKEVEDGSDERRT